ncbi:helix-turn-helix domain-containing protein, partial [Vreelandella maris]|uniref:helix-turn-helix domain-containing protein n=1 Tax=Vreelandella maris TaxID=2729617 RepID=UPI0030EDFD36
MSEERAFRGVWIPADIWLNRELSLQEKVMLIEIDSLQHPQKGCFKSNKKLAEFFGLSPNRVSEVISSLKKKGWVRVDQIREGKQIIERRIFMKRPLEISPNGTRKTEEG